MFTPVRAQGFKNNCPTFPECSEQNSSSDEVNRRVSPPQRTQLPWRLHRDLQKRAHYEIWQTTVFILWLNPFQWIWNASLMRHTWKFAQIDLRSKMQVAVARGVISCANYIEGTAAWRSTVDHIISGFNPFFHKCSILSCIFKYVPRAAILIG